MVLVALPPTRKAPGPGCCGVMRRPPGVMRVRVGAPDCQDRLKSVSLWPRGMRKIPTTGGGAGVALGSGVAEGGGVLVGVGVTEPAAAAAGCGCSAAAWG